MSSQLAIVNFSYDCEMSYFIITKLLWHKYVIFILGKSLKLLGNMQHLDIV